MCEEKSISKLSFIMFIVLQNYLMFNYFFLSSSIRLNGNVAYLSFIIIFIISLLLILLLPKKIGVIKYFNILKKSIVLKWLLVIAKFIILYMTMFIGVRTLSIALFPDTNPLIFIISLSIVSIILSNFKTENLINTSTILFIIGLIMMIVPLFFNIDLKDLTLLFPINNVKSLSTLSCIYLFLDSITLIFLNDGVDISKKEISIGVSLLFGICIFEVINLITLCGVDFLKDNEFIGFFSLYIQDTINYIGNLSFIYIYLIPVVCLFKSALSIIFIKKIVGISYNKINIFVFFFILISLYLSLKVNLLSILVYITIILLIPIYLFFLTNRNENIEVTI